MGGVAGIFYVLGLGVIVVVEEGTASELMLSAIVNAVFVFNGGPTILTAWTLL
jgi:hypothetical protein